MLNQEPPDDFITVVSSLHSRLYNLIELVDEVNSNNDYINRNVDIMFANRQVACEELNKKFGLNVKVNKNNNFENSYVQEGEEEGEIDE